METKLKPFDLEAAKNGAKVITRAGYPVQIICTDRKGGEWPVIALIKEGYREVIETYTADGRCTSGNKSQRDLIMAPVKRSGWINIYRNPDAVRDSWGRVVYVTREEAVENIARDKKYVATAFAEWEE